MLVLIIPKPPTHIDHCHIGWPHGDELKENPSGCPVINACISHAGDLGEGSLISRPHVRQPEKRT